MAISGDVQIKVSTDVLKGKSSNVLSNIKAMKVNLDEIAETISKTKSYWIGEAGDLHRELYNKQKDNVDEILSRLKEHPSDLLLIAGVYEDVEKQVTEISNELSGDVIE